MATSSDNDNDRNDAVSSNPLTEETTETLTSPSLPTLPFEIVEEILSRLPVKFLMQLKSVCKPWKSLISDPKFAKKHLRVSTTRHHLLLTYRNSSREFVITSYPLSSVFTEITATAAAGATQLDYPLLNPSHFHTFVGSCHGILCFELYQRFNHFALLWNPSIRKFVKLPSLEKPKRAGGGTEYGFGYCYDNFNDSYSYKVVAVSSFESVYDNNVKVHTLGTNSWRSIEDFPSGVSFDSSGRFLSESETINWLASNDSDTLWIIVSLDLEKECYQELVLPNYGAVTVETLTLGVVRDCLCIVANSDTFSDVWLMKEYGNKDSWTKLFRIPYMGNFESCPYTTVTYVSEDDQVLLEWQFEIVVYNSKDGTFKTPEFQNINPKMILNVYEESLISPCS
ncbi:unnamed protein product [Trifolium pratense]|uniref:Uncharacterized protein n=1 Tax=Trifolium pratense TaxID=57577 RepID=A0ACB0KQX0_TRIPR|nr:unnamed protein product [Trifolium pratense]